MKKVLVDFPIVGWASATIEVEDSSTLDQVQRMIEDDQIEVIFDPNDRCSLFPVMNLRSFVREGGDGEVPLELIVSEY